MKKILIVSACALSLCFTSCATKQAPAADSQLESSQISETAEQENLTSDEATAEASETEDSTPIEVIEEFPEPEALEEPEIITLEPEDEPEPAVEETETEEVEKEEPPVIVEPVKEPEPEQGQQPQKEIEEPQNADSTSTDGVIDITEEDSKASEQSNEIEQESEIEKEITPSRSVSLKKFEYLDVTYPGTGWIFMGLTDNSKDIAYFGRKLGTKDTKFSLQARNAGTKIAHFYKNDPLSGKYIDDYLEINILPENGSNKTHIEAPEYKLPVQKKSTPVKKTEEAPAEEINDAVKEPAKTEPSKETVKTTPAKETSKVTSVKETAKAAPVKEPKAEAAKTTPEVKEEPVAETPAPVKAPDSSTLLQEAQVLYNEKEYKTALKKINQFLEFAADKRDEGLYLKGQILEAKSEIRDIKGSIEAYTSLTKNYPASQLWDSANKRIIYLKRFYLEVR